MVTTFAEYFYKAGTQTVINVETLCFDRNSTRETALIGSVSFFTKMEGGQTEATSRKWRPIGAPTTDDRRGAGFLPSNEKHFYMVARKTFACFIECLTAITRIQKISLCLVVV